MRVQPPIHFLQWGSLTASPMNLDRDDFILYDRIEHEEGGQFFVHGKLIWRDEDDCASLEQFRDGAPYPATRQFLASKTPVKVVDETQFIADYRDGFSCASLCKPLNDSEYLHLLASSREAQEKGASASVAYYKRVQAIYGEWYHTNQLDLPQWDENSQAENVPAMGIASAGGAMAVESDLVGCGCEAPLQSRLLRRVRKLSAEGNHPLDTKLLAELDGTVTEAARIALVN